MNLLVIQTRYPAVALVAAVAGALLPWRAPADDLRTLTFGGRAGEAWADWADLNVMADHAAVAGSLQPRELLPGQNILHELFNNSQGGSVDEGSAVGTVWSGWARVWLSVAYTLIVFGLSV